MKHNKQLLTRTLRRVIGGRLSRNEAAKILGVSLRTVHNYVHRYHDKGPEGLVDGRHGHYRKISAEQELQIIACKLDNPIRSSRWIKNRLNLPVSPEVVRLVLVKHRLNRRQLGTTASTRRSLSSWNPL